MNYGRYQIIREVGRGAMGVVYEARDPNIDRVVALKVLRQDRIASETFVKRFLKEAKVVGRLSHPRIVTVYDVGEDNGSIYIAMEFLEGSSLSDLIRDNHLDAAKVVELGVQIASTLEYAHQKGVIHRDVKPSNILINADGQIKITDFGIAHIEDPAATLQTQAGEIMGTPAYMSPEQVQGHPVDNRSDIFSLGIILYELSTGMRPFGGEGKGLATIFNEIMLTTPHEPYMELPSIPKELSKTIMKALEKDPDKRFQTGKDLAVALQQCLKDKSGETPKPPSGSRVRFVITIGAILTAALAAGGMYFFSQHKELPSVGQPVKPAVVLPVSPPVKPEPEQAKSAVTPVKPVPPSVKPAPVKPAPVPASAPAPAPVPATAKPVPVNPVPVTIIPPPVRQKSDVKKVETLPPDVPTQNRPKLTAPLSPPTAPIPLPKFAFLKVRSTPKGAHVYINGILKGATPLNLKLSMGQYQVRLSHPGYRDSESKVKIEKMTDYPLTEKLKPLE